MELARFDDYYQGRPPLDRIVVRFVGDPNALVAGILAGELDVVLPVTVDLDAALELKRRWEGTGNQVQVDVTGQLPQLEMQYRDVSRPRNGFSNGIVRQAFYQAIDRQTLTDVMTTGLAPVADSWFPPSHALRSQVESAIPQYAFDPVRAQALLAQAGWTRAPDGSLVNGQTGERFEVELWGLTGQTFALERQLSIIADGWKALGAHVEFGAVPPARLREAQYVAEHPGPLFTSFAARQFSVDRMYSAAIPSAATRWSGFNRGGFSDPAVDELFERLTVTIDENQRVGIMRQMLQELMGNVVLMPLYWEVVPTLMVKGVSGPKHVGTDTTRNIFVWDKK
jgi:peptide/nickel transport system substrate-binding protein